MKLIRFQKGKKKDTFKLERKKNFQNKKGEKKKIQQTLKKMFILMHFMHFFH